MIPPAELHLSSSSLHQTHTMRSHTRQQITILECGGFHRAFS